MLIKILDQIGTTDKGAVVRFTSNYGEGVATLIGEPAIINQNYNVEIDVPTVITWGYNSFEAELAEYKVILKGNSIRLIGRIEIDSENTGSLQLGDSIILLEIDSTVPFKNKIFVEVVVPEILFHPVSY